MPIVNCVITADCARSAEDLIKRWADESGISPEHMTINIITSSEQLGAKCKIMAHLSIPSIWSKAHISLLQLGLAKALAHCFSVDVGDVHVITNIINSGLVVESGQEINW